METNEKNLGKLNRLLQAMDEDSLTRSEFTENFSKVLKFLTNLKEKNKGEFISLKQKVADLSTELKGENSTTITKLKEEFTSIIDKALKDQANGLNFLKDKAMSIKGFKDGKDADESKIVKNVLQKIVLPEFKETVLDTPVQIAEKLELLKDDNRLKIKAIKGLEEELEELKSRPIGGGGTRKVVYTKRINLSSQCNGTLKEFTMPKDCIDVLAVYGTQFPITFDEADFTFEGNVLTLTSEVSAPATGQTLFALIQTLFYGKI